MGISVPDYKLLFGDIMLTATVQSVYNCLNSLAPFSSQESWDNSGLMTGDMNADVTAILCALDFTPDTVAEAVGKGCNLIVNHHPALFHAAKSFTAGTDGLYEAARSGISVIASHTCLDAADGGVNDALCRAAKLTDIIKLYPESDGIPIMRGGKVPPQSAEDFARHIASCLGGAVRFTGVRSAENIAVCSGSGCDFLSFAAQSGYDTLLTGDASHHNFIDARNLGINLIAAGHFETERPVIDILAQTLCANFPDIKIYISEQTAPCITVIPNGT